MSSSSRRRRDESVPCLRESVLSVDGVVVGQTFCRLLGSFQGRRNSVNYNLERRPSEGVALGRSVELRDEYAERETAEIRRCYIVPKIFDWHARGISLSLDIGSVRPHGDFQTTSLVPSHTVALSMPPILIVDFTLFDETVQASSPVCFRSVGRPVHPSLHQSILLLVARERERRTRKKGSGSFFTKVGVAQAFLARPWKFVPRSLLIHLSSRSVCWSAGSNSCLPNSASATQSLG